MNTVRSACERMVRWVACIFAEEQVRAERSRSFRLARPRPGSSLLLGRGEILANSRRRAERV